MSVKPPSQQAAGKRQAPAESAAASASSRSSASASQLDSAVASLKRVRHNVLPVQLPPGEANNWSLIQREVQRVFVEHEQGGSERHTHEMPGDGLLSGYLTKSAFKQQGRGHHVGALEVMRCVQGVLTSKQQLGGAGAAALANTSIPDLGSEYYDYVESGTNTSDRTLRLAGLLQLGLKKIEVVEV